MGNELIEFGENFVGTRVRLTGHLCSSGLTRGKKAGLIREL